ncbi:MAG: hypothetical protein RR758_00860 [Burkholderiaceae bacterium]
MKANRNSQTLLHFGAVTFTALLVTACGGGSGGDGIGGGGGSGGGSSNGNGSGGSSSGGGGVGGGSLSSSSISSSNYLDASAVGAVAYDRSTTIAANLDRIVKLSQLISPRSGNVGCATGTALVAGAMRFDFVNAASFTAKPLNCEERGILMSDGQIDVTNFVSIPQGSDSLLKTGDFDFKSLTYRSVPTDTLDQSLSGNLHAERQADNSVVLTGGPLSLLRNGVLNDYKNVTLTAVGVGTSVALRASTMVAPARRFVPPTLDFNLTTITVAGEMLPVITMTAADGSRVVTSTLANASAIHPAQLRFDVYAAGNPVPIFTNSLPASDGSYTAALARALQ